MSFRENITHHLSLFVALLFLGCDHKEPPFELATADYTTHISELSQLAEMGPFEDVTIVGRVSANDLSGNFYKSIVVEDSTGAVEISLDSYDLAALYPVGCEVVVDLDGLWCGLYDGVMQIGRCCYEWNDYRIEPIATRREIDRRVRVCGVVEEVEPLQLCPSELTEGMYGRLVKIGPLRCAEEMPSRWGDVAYGSLCDRLFVGADSTRLLVRTSRYADFAGVEIPSREIFITGILYGDRHEGEDVFVLKMRVLADVE